MAGHAFLAPGVGTGKDKAHPSIEEMFTDGEVPGLSQQLDFVRQEVFTEFDFSIPEGNPGTGGRYRVGYSYFRDMDLSRYSFERWEFDVR